MMTFDDIQTQIADMQRELLALSANQAPAPRQISTFVHSVNVTDGEDEKHTAVFAGGLKLFQTYLSDDNGAYDMEVLADRVNFSIWADVGTVLTVVSLSEFNFAS